MLLPRRSGFAVRLAFRSSVQCSAARQRRLLPRTMKEKPPEPEFRSSLPRHAILCWICAPVKVLHATAGHGGKRFRPRRSDRREVLLAGEAMQKFDNAREAALALRPDDPVYCFRPEVLKADARQFMEHVSRQDRLCGEDQWRADGAEDAGRGRRRRPSTSPRRASSPPCAPSRRMPRCSTCTRSRRSPTSGWRSRHYGIRVIAVDHEDEIAKLTRVVRALDIDPGDDHRLRAHPDQGPAAPTSCRRSSAPGRPMRWSWCSGSTGRLQGRHLLPCRQPDRGSRHL